MLETELYQPIKYLLENEGYHIKAEIGNIDIFGTKNDFSIAVELKTTISLKLIYQAVDRLNAASFVYIAVPQTAIVAHKKQMKYLRVLLKKLNIGLISVDHQKASILIENPFKESSLKNSRTSKKKEKLIKEFNTRENHQNVGGTKEKRITAYKEKAIKVAFMLQKMKTASPKELKSYTGIEETPSILQKNYDKWFIKIERGIYQLTSKGEQALLKYLEVLDLQ